MLDYSESTNANEIKIFINTLQKVTQQFGSPSAGNGPFGNHSIYIGKRSNGTLQLLGNIYSMIIRGALSTADEITATETWVNGKTGAWA